MQTKKSEEPNTRSQNDDDNSAEHHSDNGCRPAARRVYVI